MDQLQLVLALVLFEIIRCKTMHPSCSSYYWV